MKTNSNAHSMHLDDISVISLSMRRHRLKNDLVIPMVISQCLTSRFGARDNLGVLVYQLAGDHNIRRIWNELAAISADKIMVHRPDFVEDVASSNNLCEGGLVKPMFVCEYHYIIDCVGIWESQ